MKTLAIIALALVTSITCPAQKTKNILDKQTYYIEVTIKPLVGKEEKITDMMTFKSGKVSSKFSKDDGFSEASYTTTSENGLISEIITFKAECTNSKNEKLTWEGTINGADIEGVATREKKGKTKALYEFKGMLKE